MIEAKNRTRGRAADSGGMFTPADTWLEEPEAQPVIARLGAQVNEFSTVDRTAHVLAVAAVVLRAKRQPFNSHARATA